MGNESCKYSVWKLITSYKAPSFPVVLNQFLPDLVILEHILIACSSSELLGTFYTIVVPLTNNDQTKLGACNSDTDPVGVGHKPQVLPDPANVSCLPLLSCHHPPRPHRGQ